MYHRRRAQSDPRLSARVTARLPLIYADGADPDLDRPSHVRSGSSLAWVGRCLAIVQDDANFIALFDPATGATTSITLPAGHDGLRQFDDQRGNKQWKLDLEACVALDRPEGMLLLALGSGSTDRRDRVVLVDGWELGNPRPRLVEATGLYQRLHAETGFSGAKLNVEGAIRMGGSLRLFNRGNGAPRNGLPATNATCDFDLSALLAYLEAPGGAEPPPPGNLTQYDLGVLGHSPLCFTDALPWGDSVLYTASAELSADATDDGPVAGSALGIIGPDGSARWTPFTDAAGAPFGEKVEGVAVGAASGGLLVVTDADNPDAVSELCTVELRGPWEG